MTQKLKLNRGEIWLANLNPSKGTEPGKTRPVLIMQDQVLLDVSHPSTLVIPLTTNIIKNAHPLRIKVIAQNHLEQTSDLLIDQIRAIDNNRLVQGPLTTLSTNALHIIDAAVCEVMGLNVGVPLRSKLSQSL